jgi:DNA polymerase, archaea type
MSKETPGSLMHKTYDNLQYVYKSFGLSFYGALGEIHTRFYDIRIAESVTLGGQYFNKAGAKFLEEKAYSIIYGDTDSLFVDHIKHDSEVVTLLKQIKNLCAKIAKEEFNADICTLEMSYDKGFKTFLIVNAKKRYAGYIDYLDGHEVNPCKLKITGFEYVRTDQCGFVKKYQKEILEWVLSDEPPTPVQIRAWILDKQTKVFSGKLPLDELMFAQKVTKPIDQYDKPMMHTKVAEQMMKDGKDFWIGDKVPYFIESFDTRKKPLPRPLYAFKGKYNESYYWNNKIFPAFERVLVVAYPTVKWDEYYIKGASTGSAKAGRSFLWN